MLEEQVIQRTVPEEALRQLVAAQQAQEDVALLLGLLSPGERAIMRKVCGFEGDYDSLSEIARELGVDKNTVGTQYRRGIKKLRSRSPEFLAGIARKLNFSIESTALTLDNE